MYRNVTDPNINKETQEDQTHPLYTHCSPKCETEPGLTKMYKIIQLKSQIPLMTNYKCSQILCVTYMRFFLIAWVQLFAKLHDIKSIL